MIEIERGNYLIEVLEPPIGSGGQGQVYKINLYNSKGYLCKGEYAIKILNSESKMDNFKDRFIREGLVQTNLIHSNIVPIYIFDLSAKEPWFVMQLADDNLENILKEKSVSEKEIITAFLCLLYGLSFIHKKKFLHRDIKPSNLLKFGDIYKIADFGLVRTIDPSDVSKQLTGVGKIVGTEKYMAGEVRLTGHYSVQSDIFSVGVVLEDICHAYPELDNRFKSIIDKCLDRRPNDRYATVEALIKEIQSIIKDIKNA